MGTAIAHTVASGARNEGWGGLLIQKVATVLILRKISIHILNLKIRPRHTV